MRQGLVYAFVLFASGVLVGTAPAEPFDELIVFGDSLSDAGNIQAAALATFGVGVPLPPYFEGRFTDGPNYADRLSELLGIAPSTTASLSGGSNYAFGFARTGPGSAVVPPQFTNDLPFSVPNVGAQIAAFANDRSMSGRALDGDELVVLWAGSNDFLSPALFGVPPNDLLVSAMNIGQHIRDLADLGARMFLVPNAPPLGALPIFNGESPEVRASLNLLSAGFRDALRGTLTSLQNDRPDLTIVPFDVFGLLSRPDLADEFGFTNITDEAWSGDLFGMGTLAPDYDGTNYLYFDGIHPTGRAHGILGDLVFAAVVPEPSSMMLCVAAAASGIPLAARRLRWGR